MYSEIEQSVMQSVTGLIVDNVRQSVNKVIEDYTTERNFIDVFITFDTYKRTLNSSIAEGVFSFDLLNRFGSYDGVGVFTPEILDNIIEIEIYEIYLPDYGGYTYNTTTTDPPLVNNTVGPPAFTRTPYGIISIEYRELIHILSAITTRYGNHFLFRAIVEGTRLRLIPLFNRVTLRSPQIIDKTATFTITDGINGLVFSEDVYRGVYFYDLAVALPPWTAPQRYVAIGLPPSVLSINDRILVSDFSSDIQNMTSYITNAGGLYISPDYRITYPFAVLTNPGITISTSQQYTRLTSNTATKKALGGTYDNGDNGVGARIDAVLDYDCFISPIVILDGVLVKDEEDASRNGVYSITVLNNTSNPPTIRLVRAVIPVPLRFGMIIDTATIARTYMLEYNITDSIIIFGTTKLRFTEIQGGLNGNIQGIISPPCTVTVINRSLVIPIRYRKKVKNQTNNITLT